MKELKGKIKLSWILIILLAIILVFNLNNTNPLPMPLGYGMAVVLSNSMEPSLVIDDLVIIKGTQDIDIGDIIVYQSEDTLIIHRVIGIDGDTVTTQGDANNVADPPFDISDVKGRMIARIPFIGRLISILKTPIGLVCATVIVLLISELIYRGNVKEEG